LDHDSIGAYGSSFPKRRRAIRTERSENRTQLLGRQRVKLVKKYDLQTVSLNGGFLGIGENIPAPSNPLKAFVPLGKSARAVAKHTWVNLAAPSNPRPRSAGAKRKLTLVALTTHLLTTHSFIGVASSVPARGC
jgi:hypothetical protein